MGVMKEKSKILFMKVLNIVEEIIILLISCIAVILSDVISKYAKGNNISEKDLSINWLSLIVSCILALMCYGTMYTKFKFDDIKKPPLIKRISASILNGIAWRSIVGWSN